MGVVYGLTASWLVFSAAPAVFRVEAVSDQSCTGIFLLMTLSERNNTTVLCSAPPCRQGI